MLEPFLGSPRKLLIHQLLLSPQFGLETVDSFSVEELKNEYRQLKEDKSLSKPQQDRLSSIASELKTLPDWFDGPAQASSRSALSRTRAARRSVKHTSGKG